jgi:hypothetical protein
MVRFRKKQATRLRRQLALGLLQTAMSKAEKGHSRPEPGYSEGAPADGSPIVIHGVPGAPEILENVDAEHPYPIR